MARFNELKSANEQYAASFGKGDLLTPPARNVAVVTCMDAMLHSEISRAGRRRRARYSQRRRARERGCYLLSCRLRASARDGRSRGDPPYRPVLFRVTTA